MELVDMTEIIVKKNWHSTEELVTFHDKMGIVMVKTLHSKGTCSHDKNNSKIYWHSTEELATFHDNI